MNTMLSSTCFFISTLCLCHFALKAHAKNSGQNGKSVLLSYHEHNAYSVYEPCKCRKHGTFSFLFNTPQSEALLAYQDDGTFNNFDLFLINGKLRARVLFDECRPSKTLVIKGNFSDSRWHRVQLTTESTKLTLTVDGCHSQSIPCSFPPLKQQKWNALYVGNIPFHIERNFLAKPGILAEAIKSGFQGCIGQVTHSARGKLPKPLPLRTRSETGLSCERLCIFSGKCDNHTDDVTGSEKECECPGYEIEKQFCRDYNLTHAKTSLLIGFNETNSFSAKVTPNLMSSSQSQVLPTAASLLNTASSSSSDRAQEYLEYGPSSVITYSTSSSQTGAVVISSSSIISVSAKPSSSTAVLFSSSVDKKAAAMAKKSSAFFLRGSCVLLYLGLFIAVQSGWPCYVQ